MGGTGEQGGGKRARERFLRVKQTGNRFYTLRFLCARTMQPLLHPGPAHPSPCPGTSSWFCLHTDLCLLSPLEAESRNWCLTFPASSLPGGLERSGGLARVGRRESLGPKDLCPELAGCLMASGQPICLLKTLVFFDEMQKDLQCLLH